MTPDPIRIYYIDDDGRIVSRLASPEEAETAIREHTAFARLKDAEEDAS